MSDITVGSRYETLLSQLTGDFERRAGCLVDDASDTAIKFKVLASEFARLYDRLDDCQRQIFPNTAEGDFLARHGAVRGIYKKEASPAVGKAVFSCRSAPGADLLIPRGTLCTSSKSGGLVYRTTADAVIAKGATYTVAEVESVDTGAGVNLAPGYLDILITPVAGVDAVTNTEKLSGGADAEPDAMFRQRVIESFSRISNGANLNYYEQFAKSKPNIWYAKARFVSGTPNLIELYVQNYTRTLTESACAELQESIDQARELGIQVIVKLPKPKVVDIQAAVRIDNLANRNTYAVAAEDAIRNATLALSIGQRWSPAVIGRRVLDLPGVLDVSFTSPTLPVYVADNEICTAGSVAIASEKG